MNFESLDFDTIGKLALGGLIVLTAVFAIALLTIREVWRWARQHLSSFDQIQAVAKGGKIQIGATIEDVRAKAPEHAAEVVSLDERRGAGT